MLEGHLSLFKTLFEIARSKKEPNCPLTKERIKNVVHMHNGKQLTINNKAINNFAGKWIELENITLSEVFQSLKDT